MYTSSNLVAKQLGRKLTDDELALLAMYIPAVSIWINRKTGSNFDSVEQTTRVYDGGESFVDIDAATEITSVQSVDDYGSVVTDYTADQYLVEPANSPVKTSIALRLGKFLHGEGRVRVTGKFSEYSSGVPEDIQTAATLITAGLLNKGKTDADGNGIKSKSIEGFSVTYATAAEQVNNFGMNHPMVLSILDSHKEILLG